MERCHPLVVRSARPQRSFCCRAAKTGGVERTPGPAVSLIGRNGSLRRLRARVVDGWWQHFRRRQSW
ncbi:hypothetical protein [Streptomyces sp. NPDC058739]|uniref:hypothetical protein n=1 Tax=Streptomyces sp. NPDC058739 TaxID=3346618 RepID=UPI0036969894